MREKYSIVAEWAWGLIWFYGENEAKEENNAPSIFAPLKKEKEKKKELEKKHWHWQQNNYISAWESQSDNILLPFYLKS